MKDYIIRGMACNNEVRFFASYTKEIVETARSAHNTSPVMTAALGRLLSAGAMMGVMGKNEDDLVTLQIQCSGPAEGLLVTADAHGTVKGYAANPVVLLPPSKKGKLDVGKAIDLGILTVIKDIGLPECYSGQTHLVSGEIAEDLTYYFATSEQIPTSVSLGVLMEKSNTVRQAGGYIIQLMPFASEETISFLEERLKNYSPVTTCFDNGMTPEDIIRDIFDEQTVEITDTIPASFSCNCSKERMAKGLKSIAKRDLQEMIEDGEPIELNCHFCNSHYIFTPEELQALLD